MKEDLHRLKAVLTFQVPDEVAHEDVDCGRSISSFGVLLRMGRVVPSIRTFRVQLKVFWKDLLLLVVYLGIFRNRSTFDVNKPT
ncbi:hypothetical protein Tco_0964015 [Tanacetum coccineum]